MIAPLRLPEPPAGQQSRPLHEARKVVAAALLEPRRETGRKARPIRAWQAWLFVAWVAVVTAVYFASMIGLL